MEGRVEKYRSSSTVDRQIAPISAASPRNQGHFRRFRLTRSTGRRETWAAAGMRTAGGLGNTGEGCSQGPPFQRPSFLLSIAAPPEK